MSPSSRCTSFGLDVDEYPNNCSKLLFEHPVSSPSENLPPKNFNNDNPRGSIIQRILSYVADKQDKDISEIDLNNIPSPFYETDSTQSVMPENSSSN